MTIKKYEMENGREREKDGERQRVGEKGSVDARGRQIKTGIGKARERERDREKVEMIEIRTTRQANRQRNKGTQLDMRRASPP